jgi:hypothetical protein
VADLGVKDVPCDIGTGKGVAEMDWAKGRRLAPSFSSMKTTVEVQR